MVPRKYFETTMLVACCDQNFGISTSRCSKTTFPFSLPMTADRISHSISSNGSIPSRVKNRSYSRPVAFDATGVDGRARASVLVDSTCGAAPLCIIPSDQRGVTSQPLARTRKNKCKWMGARERYEHGASNTPRDVPARAGKFSFGSLRRRKLWTLFTRMSRVDLQDIVPFI